MDLISLFFIIVLIIVGILAIVLFGGLALYSFALLLFAIDPDFIKKRRLRKEYEERLAKSKEEEEEEA